MRELSSFTVIGLGKVGKIFTHLFKESLGLKLEHIIDTEEDGNFLDINIEKKIPIKIDSDLIIISTPDDSITSIINLLNESVNIKQKAILLHFSGALYIKQQNIISIHPMMSITDYKNDLARLKNHYFTLQSDNTKLIKLFTPIIKKITKNFIIINGEDKKYFHLSAVMINNFSTALVKSSVEVIKNLDIKEDIALKILLPLFEDVFINLINNQDIKSSLTGPIIRNDYKTIKKHQELLKNIALDDERLIYDVFLKYIVKNF